MKKSEKSSYQYADTFKNLSADEVKTRFYYHPDGKLSDKKLIKSLFFVYQSPTNKIIDEFRSVLEYNGKDVARNEKQTVKFFEKIEKASSDQKVNLDLRNESNRFEKGMSYWGITLGQINPFYNFFRPFFEYSVVGKDIIEGRNVVIVEYNQIKTTNQIQVNSLPQERRSASRIYEFSTSLPDLFRPTYPLMKGKIWIDAETGQVWKNEFKISIKPEVLSKNIITAENTYQYQSSKFGILVPKEFRFVTYQVQGKNDLDLKVTKWLETKFEYSNFAAINSEIKKYEVGK